MLSGNDRRPDSVVGQQALCAQHVLGLSTRQAIKEAAQVAGSSDDEIINAGLQALARERLRHQTLGG